MFEIDSFEQQCLIINVFLQYKQLKQHMVSIGVDQ